jgi:hypothetical protein
MGYSYLGHVNMASFRHCIGHAGLVLNQIDSSQNTINVADKPLRQDVFDLYQLLRILMTRYTR